MASIAFRRGSTLADPDCLTDVDAERPEPGPHDLLVAVRAVSVNPVDTKIRAGLVDAPDSVRSLGWDAAGVVEAVGDAVTLFQPGQKVYYAGSFDRSGSNDLHELAELIAPQGRLAIIDDHDTLDAAPFKAKSVSLHWEMVFTRPLYRTPDMIAQHRILDEVAALVDAGVLRSTVSRVLHPLDAARLIEAHRLVELGGVAGKVVVARSMDDTAQPALQEAR
ncbi:alcohol dehydrogenase catalytic domain-containing protein [Acidovorax sacchari]|uniref:alcohol dehydrogenase catalytic domain-containing protein n=1 Tax=Acidovorax sacchari TaxID=3230736 RepID=UPI0039E46987